MRTKRLALFALMCTVLVPAGLYAQTGASISGTVKDASGQVIPGVTVEAASPALIEKTRAAVTDGTGQYKIVGLVPGTYTVTFTLAGFSTFKREGIELGGSFVAGNLVFTSTLEEHTFAMRVSDGKILWRIKLGKYSPGIVTERHYFFTLNGIVMAWHARQSPQILALERAKRRHAGKKSAQVRVTTTP